MKEESRLDGISEDQPCRRDGRSGSFTARFLKLKLTSYLILQFLVVNKINTFLKNSVKIDVFFSTRPYIIHMYDLRLKVFGTLKYTFVSLS